MISEVVVIATQLVTLVRFMSMLSAGEEQFRHQERHLEEKQEKIVDMEGRWSPRLQVPRR